MAFNVYKAQDFMENAECIVRQVSETSKKLADSAIYQDIKENLNALAREAFPDSAIDVYFFGSRINGLADNDSDLDIFIDIGKSYNSNISKDQIQRLNDIVAALEKDSSWEVKKVLQKTTVPIVMAEYLPMKLDCDINVANGFSFENSKLIKHLYEIPPDADLLYHYIRKWIKVQGFEIKGYTIALLVIFYLQQKNLMPSVERVQAGILKKTISGWEVQFNPDRTLTDYHVHVMSGYKQHVAGFFHYYAQFSFDKVISPFNGHSCDVNTFTPKFPQFEPGGLNVAGPCNKKNCGKVGEGVKEKFIEFCKASSSFFQQKGM